MPSQSLKNIKKDKRELESKMTVLLNKFVEKYRLEESEYKVDVFTSWEGGCYKIELDIKI